MKQKLTIPPQFLELLRCGLWGTTPDSALFRSLTSEQWLSLLLMSQQQGVTGLMSDSVLRLPEACQPPGQLRMQWFGYNHAVRHQQKLSVPPATRCWAGLPRPASAVPCSRATR